MSAKIVVYRLNRKYVNRQEDIPEDARQVMYYALAVGHHVGVLDCFSSLMDIPLDEFCAWLELLPEGAGRSKLEGVLRWGEIEINRGHVSDLLPLVEEAPPEQARWAAGLENCLRAMLAEPAFYLMLKKVGG